MTEPRPVVRWITNAFLVAASVVVTLVTAEVALRFTPFGDVAKPERIDFPVGYFQADAEMGFDLAPNRPPETMRFRGPSQTVFTNSINCFDWEREVQPGYVVAIGDSMTWGWADLEAKWTSLLEQRLGKQVLKCGVPDTGTKYQAAKLRRTIERVGHPPSMVIWLYIENDFNDDIGFPNTTSVGGELISTIGLMNFTTGVLERADADKIQDRYRRQVERRSAREPFRERVVLWRLARVARESMGFVETNAADDPTGREPNATGSDLRPLWRNKLYEIDVERYPWVAQAFEQHAQSVLSIEPLVESYGAKLVFVMGVRHPESALQAELDARLRTIFKHYFDYSLYERAHAEFREVRYLYDNHWNERGNRLAADGIFEFLEKEGLAPRSP